MYLTRGQRRVLEALNKGAELAHEEPGGWYLGGTRVSGVIGRALIGACLISPDPWGPGSTGHAGGRGKIAHYHINDWGRQALADPDFLPPPLQAGR